MKLPHLVFISGPDNGFSELLAKNSDDGPITELIDLNVEIEGCRDMLFPGEALDEVYLKIAGLNKFAWGNCLYQYWSSEGRPAVFYSIRTVFDIAPFTKESTSLLHIRLGALVSEKPSSIRTVPTIWIPVPENDKRITYLERELETLAKLRATVQLPCPTTSQPDSESAPQSDSSSSSSQPPSSAPASTPGNDTEQVDMWWNPIR